MSGQNGRKSETTVWNRTGNAFRRQTPMADSDGAKIDNRVSATTDLDAKSQLSFDISYTLITGVRQTLYASQGSKMWKTVMRH